MIDYKQFHFGAAPRTGSTWVMRAASVAGFGLGFKTEVHSPPAERCLSWFNVTLVRHPYEWLISYYYFLQGGAVNQPLVDVLMPAARKAMDFEHFVLLYAEGHAGQFTKIVKSYCGDSVIRTEELKRGIIELFRTLGVSEDRLEKIQELSPINVNNRKGDFDNEIPYLQGIVMRAEPELYEHFDYGLSGDVR